ncbi:hypothetical protein SAR116_2536 [Candidatus Puniceispirillum marinum IMCC1322]|uniref:Uncharacterized protein n=1 Tax=Puniceispirillum marinum (strain IMCC1322) TaxID=488538 RepID=D5BR44_PUNMI|nr:hypothetical protein SAR116_2536 [Candidatus Puniceispirillum marinum IMCC1322]
MRSKDQDKNEMGIAAANTISRTSGRFRKELKYASTENAPKLSRSATEPIYWNFQSPSSCLLSPPVPAPILMMAQRRMLATTIADKCDPARR